VRKRLSAICASAALLFSAGLTTVAAPAYAGIPAPCDSVPYANRSDGVAYFRGTYNLKVAPAQECGNVASVPQGSKFYLWCYVYNHYGTEWVYGRVAGTQTQGWTSSSNVKWESGSLLPCSS
jgi:hypothetical protein